MCKKRSKKIAHEKPFGDDDASFTFFCSHKSIQRDQRSFHFKHYTQWDIEIPLF